ncbi:hypothetical protein TVAG_174560 [Trichomonas vaginalis G3]|uniref:Spindle assembly abnormal protein 6 N-terminal domain-containing protein n=1 Tax=Trichomonas vaginalis (strain ATCC PRA-98 / G3) TaxID=412133 RepID=A2EK03_TRIV3|nr:assembly abnormal protein 6-related family [Trichomonas vaginalis G3]EAY06987.1 hypothetical protein TVAG_174560 [Trichomonas vaginalis G3]KAI5488833.1 assembly abnormal protein 6-related family [Trichomonas vaginalis G3]|eukprot:XP_001319210.1 hypothetical protein [Trichomonas vaginalis G3]
MSPKEYIDPSLEDGGEIKFDEDTPLKFQDEQKNIVPDAPFHMRIITYDNDTRFRIEVTMEADLYFFYFAEFEEKTFDDFKNQSGLSINFKDFITSIMKYIHANSQKDPNYTIVLSQGDNCQLGFKQSLEIKQVDLFDVELEPETDEFIRRQIQYRFDKSRADLKAAREQKEDLCRTMRVSEPKSSSSILPKSPVTPPRSPTPRK